MGIFLKSQRIVEHDFFLGMETEKKIGDGERLLQDLGQSLS